MVTVRRQQCLALPVEWVHESPEPLEAAAAVEAQHTVSLADAWIAACAQLASAVLVHKDPKFEPLGLAQDVLPYQ